MGTLVLKPEAVYQAYLAGYLGLAAGDTIDPDKIEQLDASEIPIMLAMAIGMHDSEHSNEPQSATHLLLVIEGKMAALRPPG